MSETDPGPTTEQNPPAGLQTSGDLTDSLTLSPIEMFKACADPGRKKSLRSLEIPLDLLLSGIAFLSGGHDGRNSPILSLTQPEQRQVEMLMEITDTEMMDLLAYFTSIPKEDVRARGFSVLVDADVIHDFLVRNMIKALHSLQSQDDTPLFHAVYFISSTKDCSVIDWAQECGGEGIDLPFVHVKSYSDLEQFVATDQLTKQFGGTLEYDHQDWVRFRMQVEPFICDCVSISKRLTRAIEPFTKAEVPRTIREAEESLKHHKLTRKKTFDTLHMDDLASEGEIITQRMETVRRTSKTFQGNPDFANTMSTVQKLLSQIETVKERVEVLWTTRQEKLEANLRQRVFEKEAKQIIEWFEECAEEFFQTNTELGESLDIAVALVMEVQQFETSTQQILQRTDTVVKSGNELESHPFTDKQTIQWLMGKIRQLMTDFDSRLSKRKKKLNDSVKLHKLIESALDWCIESAGLLSEHDVMSANPLEIDPDFTKAEFDQFLDDYPGPSEEDLQQLLDLSEESESHWTKENALFAYNRVLEIADRFRYYQTALEGMVVDKRERERQEEQEKRELMRRSERLLSAVDSLIGTVSGETGPVLKKDKSIDSVFDHLEPRVDDTRVTTDEGLETTEVDEEPDFGRQKSRQTPLTSLHYESDVDEALMLLESAVRSASDRLDTQRAAPPPGALEGGEYSSDEDPGTNHRLSKQDISGPTHTAGALFTEQEQPDTNDPRRLSIQEPEEDLTSQTKHAKHRRQLMEELITTEEAYIRDMERVVEHYMPAMDDLDELPRNLIGKKNIIFSNINQLLEFNRQVILPELRQCKKCPIKLGQIFLNFEEDFLNYAMYFKNMPLQKKLMEEGGIEFFNHTQRSLGDSFFLGSYLIKPFQRVARYKLFLQDMIKHSTRIDLKGKLKEYYDKLKDAHKMVDFVLRHGNDLLAVECLRGFEGSLLEQGKILRQGDLTVIERTKHRRRVFLFEHTIVFSKKKPEKHKSDIAGSETFEFRHAHKTSDLSLRENIPGYPMRFELKKKKESLILQADSEEAKNDWVQDIWDLFFGHMLSLKDQNLEAYGSRPLTSIVASGTATLTRGRTMGRSMRRRLTIGSRTSRELRSSRPPSITSTVSNLSATSRGSGGGFDEVSAMIRPNRHTSYSPTSPRISATFVDLRAGKRLSGISVAETEASESSLTSNRSSIISTASTSTITSLSGSNQDVDVRDKRMSQLISEVRRADGDGTSLSLEKIDDPIPVKDGGPTPHSSLRLESDSSDETFPVYDTPV